MNKTAHQKGFTLLEMVVVIGILAIVAGLVLGRYAGVKENGEDTVAKASMQAVREAFTGSAEAPGLVADMKRVPGFQQLNIRAGDLFQQGGYAPYDPIAQRGWRGPYLENNSPVRNTNPARNGTFPDANEKRFAGDVTFLARKFFTTVTFSPYGAPGDPAIADPWGNPIVLQIPDATFFATPTDAKRIRYLRLVSAGPDGVLDTPLDRMAGMANDGNITARGDDLVLFLNRTDVYEPEENP